MGNNRKLGKRMTICFIMLCFLTLMVLSGCGKKTATVEFSEPIVSLTENSTDNYGGIGGYDLTVDKTYYFVFSTTMTTKKYVPNTSATVEFSLDNAEYIYAEIQDADTDNVISQDYQGGKKFTASYSVPNEGYSIKLRVIISIRPMMKKDNEKMKLKYSFYGNIKDVSGSLPSHSYSFGSVKNKLSKPVLNYDKSHDTLYWSQVKGADYYYIYVDYVQTKITINGKSSSKYTVPDNLKHEGATISLSVSCLGITGPHDIYIEADCDNANYEPSASSNHVQTNS